MLRATIAIALLIAPVAAAEASAADAGERPIAYRDLASSAATFPDSIPPHVDADTLTAIRIGVMAPFDTPDGAAILDGVRLAISEANDAGGHAGLPFEVVARTSAGPWGVAAKQVAALAYDDAVWAIVGGVDGGEAHLAELIVAKAWVPVVVPTASDYTIDYANVPWVFRASPDDRAQAIMLWQYAIESGWRSVVVLTEGSRDGRTAQRRILDAARDLGTPPELMLQYPPGAPARMAGRALSSAPEAVLVWGRAKQAAPLIRAIAARSYVGCVLGSSALAEASIRDLGAFVKGGELVVTAPFDVRLLSDESLAFVASFRDATGRAPRSSAALAYDSARMIVAAVKTGGLNRAAIRSALARTETHGVAGAYSFGSLGGVRREPVLMRWTDSGWERLEQTRREPAMEPRTRDSRE